MDEERKYVRNWARPFVVNGTPYCFWDPDIAEHNMLFIRQLDVSYFEFVAEQNWSILKELDEVNRRDDKKSQYAAIGLRIAYSQALEVLFSWLFATLQAPDCVIGWVSRYNIRELTDLIRTVQNQGTILSRFPDLGRGWEGVVEFLFHGIDEVIRRVQAKVLEGFVHLLAASLRTF